MLTVALVTVPTFLLVLAGMLDKTAGSVICAAM